MGFKLAILAPAIAAQRAQQARDLVTVTVSQARRFTAIASKRTGQVLASELNAPYVTRAHAQAVAAIESSRQADYLAHISKR